MDIKIDYNGKYPCLCMGDLKVTVDGIEYDFGSMSLHSGGGVSFDEDWMEDVSSGEWGVDFPDNFPQELEVPVRNAINEEIPWGCCGGCV